MVFIPAVCARGHVFIPRSMLIQGNVRGLRLQDNSVGACPRCGAPAALIDGDFDVKDDEIITLDAPQRTKDALAALKKALDDTRSGRNPDEIVSELKNFDPKIAHYASAAVKSGGSGALILLLIFFLTGCLKTEGKVDWNMLFDQAQVLITGGEAYPAFREPKADKEPKKEAEKKADEEKKPGISRQQRRKAERDAAKSHPPPPPRPKLPKAPKK